MRSLVIVAHMDDEALSCGALITRSDEPHIIVVYGRKYPGKSEEEQKALDDEQKNQFCRAVNTLRGTRDVGYLWLDLEEGEPGKTGFYDVLVPVERYMAEEGPFDEIVFPSSHDMNQDHQHLNRLMQIVCRPANLGSVKRVLKSFAHDSNMSTPQYFVPMTEEVLDRKLRAVACYEVEARKAPHPRCPENIEALARLHGSKCGSVFAEGYEVHMIKEVTE